MIRLNFNDSCREIGMLPLNMTSDSDLSVLLENKKRRKIMMKVSFFSRGQIKPCKDEFPQETLQTASEWGFHRTAETPWQQILLIDHLPF